MQKRLPVNKNHNMTATFEHALPMSVILAEPKLKNWVDENFINVCTVRFVDNFNFDYCGNGVNYDYYAELFDFYAIVFLDHKYLAGDPSRTEGFIHSLVIYGYDDAHKEFYTLKMVNGKFDSYPCSFEGVAQGYQHFFDYPYTA